MAILFLFAACWSFASPFGAFLGAGHDLRAAARLPRQSRPGHLDLLARDQPRLVAGHDRGCPRDPARLLGLPSRSSRRKPCCCLIWVGFFALFRGFSDILSGVRGARRPAEQVAHSQGQQHRAYGQGHGPAGRGTRSAGRDSSPAREAGPTLDGTARVILCSSSTMPRPPSPVQEPSTLPASPSRSRPSLAAPPAPASVARPRRKPSRSCCDVKQ